MTHDLYREWLQRELDDDLSADELVMLDAHVKTCADCRLEREEYQSLSFGLSKLSRVMPEKSFVPQLELEVQRALQAHRRTRKVPVWWRSATAAAAVALVVGVSVAGYWQFAGQGGSGVRVALDSSTKQSKDNTRDPNPSSPTDSVKQDAGKEPSKPVASEEKQQQPTPAVTPKTEQAPARVPQKNAPAPVAERGIGDAIKPETTAPATPPTPVEPKGPLIGGHFGTTDEGGGHTSATPGDAQGIAGGGPVGILGDGGEQPTPRIGRIEPLPRFTANMQKAVQQGDATTQWATDSVRVVEHTREQLGFRADATVTKTLRTDRVRIEQDGMEYEVRLEQPFVKGAAGIWRPVQVGRVIQQSAPDMLERPIVDYFRNSLPAQQNTALHGELLIIGAFNEESHTMVVSADLESKGVEQVRQYLCKLRLDTEGKWELDGSPVEQ